MAVGGWWLLDEAVAIWEGLYIAEDISLHPVIYDIGDKVVEGGRNLAWNYHVFTEHKPLNSGNLLSALLVCVCAGTACGG